MDWDQLTAWVVLVLKWVIHALSGAAVLGYLAGMISVVFAIPPFCFYCIQLYESKTVRRWIAHRRHRKLVKLEAKIRLLKSHDE